MTDSIEIHPLSPERWKDLEKLFGPRGAYGGCWCMYWRVARSEFKAGQGKGNQRALHRIVDDGGVPGVLAYRGREAVGWCSIAPRSRARSPPRTAPCARSTEHSARPPRCVRSRAASSCSP